MMDWLAAQAGAKPDGVALTFAGAAWTWRALHDDVDALCSRLASLRVNAGGIIAMHLPSSPIAVQLVHAAARMGFVLAPLNTRLTHAELRAQLALLQADALICNDVALCEALRDVVSNVMTVDALQQMPAQPFVPQPIALESVQAIVFTSGSSGLPKGVALTFGNHFYSALGSAARLGAFPNDVWLSCLPLYHVGGLSVLFRAALYGFTVVLHERFDVETFKRALAAEPITLVSLVPTMLRRLMDANTTWPATLRAVLLGGAAAPASLMAEALQRNIPIATTYGLTEAASQVATQTPDATKRKPASVGKPLLFTQVRIVDEGGSALPANAIGEVALCGPTVMREYIRNAPATQRALRNGELFTGDLGFLDGDGDLHLVQRRSDLIVTGGENVYPSEVEEALRGLDAVEDALVIGVPDEEWGQRVAALVVLRDETVMGDDLHRMLNGRIAPYKIPRLIRIVPQLPLLPNGKIDRAGASKLFESEED
jgi:O-succinylbenzoic acid--CoA ligase